MKKILVLLLVFLLITGCGESEEDYTNEDNHEEFLMQEFANAYEKELVIVNKIDKGNSEYIYDVYLKEDPNFKFMACTYWDVAAAVPTRHYNWDTNYKEKYITQILEREFATSTYGSFTYEIREDEKYVSKNCIMDYHTDVFTLNSLEYIDKLAEKLYDIGQKEYFYSISLFVEYNGKRDSLSIKKEYDKNYYINELNRLKS